MLTDADGRSLITSPLSEAGSRSINSATPGSSVLDDEVYEVEVKRFWGMTAEHIPLIMIISDLLSGLASGMTIKFFPLYFARQVRKHIYPEAQSPPHPTRPWRALG